MIWLLLASMLLTFLITLFITPYFMRFFLNTSVIAIDQQKQNKPVVPTSGGMPVVFSFFIGMLLCVAINTFWLKENLDLIQIIAALLSIFAISLMGFFDDLYVKKFLNKNASDAIEYRVGLKQWMKPLLTLFAAVPLMAVNAGVNSMVFPFIGVIDLGLLYPLLLLPIAIVAVSNATNMLAGINGLESGMMIIAASALGVWALMNGRTEGAIIAFVGVASLLAFLKFNWSPAKMLPGDSLTYFSGAMFASAVIIGNVEKFGLVLFTPWIIEFFLKLRGGFKKRSYGDLQAGGWIKTPYKKIYSLTHVAMKLLGRKATERNISLLLISFELLVVAIAFLTVKPI
ncbi:MAG: hypothetical protein ABH803_04160 [Candidatus Micrarchaeota archaeon]